MSRRFEPAFNSAWEIEMSNWMLYRDEDGKQVAINLDAAAMIVPVIDNEKDAGTRIVFPGDTEWTHINRPFEDVFKAAFEGNRR